MNSSADQRVASGGSFRDRLSALADEHEALLHEFADLRRFEEDFVRTRVATEALTVPSQSPEMTRLEGQLMGRSTSALSDCRSDNTSTHATTSYPLAAPAHLQKGMSGHSDGKISEHSVVLGVKKSHELKKDISQHFSANLGFSTQFKAGWSTMIHMVIPESLRSTTCCGLCTCLRLIEQSKWFNHTCTATIMLNTVAMGLSTELIARRIVTEVPFVLQCSEVVFVFIYFCELVIRVSVNRLNWFIGDDWGWHWMDCVLVVTAVQERLEYFIGSGDGRSDVAVFRLARLLKAVKLLRVVRVLRSLDELRLILDSIMGSMRAMVWVAVLISTVTFMFALCFMQGVDYTEAYTGHWSDLLTSMLHLTSFAFGGENWLPMYWTLMENGVMYSTLFYLYIMFFNLIVVNTVTSVFVESLLHDKANNDFLIMEERMMNKQRYMNIILKMFTQIETYPGGGVRRDQLMSWIHHADMKNFAAVLDIQEIDLELFVNVLTSHGQRAVDLETFVVGCIKLRGTAKSIDLLELARDVSRISKTCQAIQSNFNSYIDSCSLELSRNPSKEQTRSWETPRRKTAKLTKYDDQESPCRKTSKVTMSGDRSCTNVVPL